MMKKLNRKPPIRASFKGKVSPGLLITAICAGLLFQGCGSEPAPSAPPQITAVQPSPVSSPLTGFERDLQFIRNGNFTYVLVISRKDGKPLDKEDGAFLRKNASQVVDWVTTDGGKKAIGGTNFNFEEGNMEMLKKRFVIEDYSGK